MQKGYDIDVLKNAYCKFDFLTLNSQRPNAKSFVKNLELEQALEDLCAQFFKNLPRYKSWLAKLFRSYRQNVVYGLRLMKNHLSNGCEMLIHRLFCTLLALKIPNNFCRVANRLDIPVFFFKHGGIAETFLPPSILDPYLEHNPHLKRLSFCTVG